ncbi:MAG: hypothetical protein WCZ89_09925 [Phycisphaerae bacterium]
MKLAYFAVVVFAILFIGGFVETIGADSEIATEQPAADNDDNQGSPKIEKVSDANDPNKDPIEAKWANIEKAGETEAVQWLRTDADNIALLVKDVNEQSTDEMMLLRKIAEQENAEQTVKAIDRLISIRTQRYAQITEKARDERRQRMLQQREERRTRTSERRGPEDRQRMTDERRSRTRRPGQEDSEY